MMEYLVHNLAKKSPWTRNVSILGAGGTGVSSSHVEKGGDSMIANVAQHYGRGQYRR
jgi:hypothetical protein